MSGINSKLSSYLYFQSTLSYLSSISISCHNNQLVTSGQLAKVTLYLYTWPLDLEYER